ncbi:MAG: flagellar biosynthetic protein FliR [Treponema sp.]|jgi:flagellar biosynthetic protein FliR|nr:flagellar biosynthetic protein FliR [Treponema sp.]
MITEELLNEILLWAPAFLLIAARALAIIETAPLLSSDAIPQAAKISLAALAAFAVLPRGIDPSPGFMDSYPMFRLDPVVLNPLGLYFFLLLIGEAVIGVITGFFITIIFSAFSTAGQFFSLQMGFGASETFDPLSQIENPLMGQYLNLVAMLVFLIAGGFQELFLGGFWRSVQSLSIASLAAGREQVLGMLLMGLSRLFLDAIIISMPILGTLFLTSLATGLISKAAPQINILSEGFPVSITVAFLLIFTSLPYMMEAFSRVIDAGFSSFQDLLVQVGEQIADVGINP